MLFVIELQSYAVQCRDKIEKHPICANCEGIFCLLLQSCELRYKFLELIMYNSMSCDLTFTLFQNKTFVDPKNTKKLACKEDGLYLRALKWKINWFENLL